MRVSLPFRHHTPSACRYTLHMLPPIFFSMTATNAAVRPWQCLYLGLPHFQLNKTARTENENTDSAVSHCSALILLPPASRQQSTTQAPPCCAELDAACNAPYQMGLRPGCSCHQDRKLAGLLSPADSALPSCRRTPIWGSARCRA